MGSSDFVQRLLEFRADASVATYALRNPGNWTPLQCLVEAGQSMMDTEDV